MQRLFDGSARAAVATAILAGLAGVAGSYAVAGYTRSFVVAPVASWITAVVPGAVLRFAVVTVTDVGRRFGVEHLGAGLNLVLAVGLTTLLFGALAFGALAVGRRFGSRAAVVGLAGGLVAVTAALVTGAPAAAVGAGVGSAAVLAAAAAAAALGPVRWPDAPTDADRRRVVGGVAGALGVGVLSAALGRRGATDPLSSAGASTESSDGGTGEATGGGATTDVSPEVERLLSEAEEKSLGVPGLEGLVSGEDFYTVDTSNVDPDVDAAEWTLSVTGAVGEEVTYGYDEITSMEREHRFVTLRCVSDPVNGENMDNGLWTGVPFERLIDGADPEGEYVMLRSVDGYYEEFPMEALRSGMLAYGKDGGTLPRRHGYPARALIPGHWGEINVKWLDEIEVLDRPAKGFWEERGWHGTGPVNTVAKLHATNRHDGRVTVGGHANAGSRGIRRVEVSTDGGETWSDARLSEELTEEADDVWRQWAYTYDAPEREHEVVVRAVDGTGTVQPSEETGPYPRGATGWASTVVG